jgi:hypothetical protein
MPAVSPGIDNHGNDFLDTTLYAKEYKRAAENSQVKLKFLQN